MAVAGIGVERHVADHPDIADLCLDGAHGAADEVVRVESLARLFVAKRGIGVGKERDRRQFEPGGGLGGLTARSMESRSTPGMLATSERSFFPSMTKIGQIRSSAVSVVSRTSRRDQSERRLRLSRVAGKPGSGVAGVLPRARLMRSVRRATVFSLGEDMSRSISRGLKGAGKLAPGAARGQQTPHYGFGTAMPASYS